MEVSTQQLSVFNTRQHLLTSSLAFRHRFGNILCQSSPTLKEQPLYRTMSQRFLEGLLSATESRVNSDQDAKCMVCLEDYNTLNTSTGIVEWEMRLPCGHRIGSSCIVTWLQVNNNCPACRAIFFPAQPRPHLEHGISNNDRPRPARVCRRPEMLAEELTRNFCRAFHDGTVSDVVGVVSRCMTPHLMRFLQNHTQQEIAATSIYMASHMVGRPKTLIEISRVAGVSPNQIHSVYRQVYPNRVQCIDARNLGVIAGYHAEGMLAYLPPPDRGNGTVDDEEDGPEPHQHFPLHHLLDEVGEILAMNLGDSTMVNIISERIARRVVREIVRDTVLD